jgi:photosynthetic reaction center H subunit
MITLTSPEAASGLPIPVEEANPMLSGKGPASWAIRADEPDYTAHGTPKIRPLRVLPTFSLERRDPDPRGWPVLGADGAAAGTVTDVWVDTAEPQVRYYEMRVESSGRSVLVPYGFVKVRTRRRVLTVHALHARHFADVPGTRGADTVTLREEDQIMGYFAGGLLWADPRRAEPVL